jgi:septal ring factor EnvC (AmiA/AmiB activator)
MNPIIPIQRSETIDYSHQSERNFWLINPVSTNELGKAPIAAEIENFLQHIHPAAEVVCVASSELSNQRISNWCLKMAQEGKRVYVLTGQQPADSKALAGSCLMRFELPLVGSLVLVDPHNTPRGIFFNGPFSKEIPSQAGRLVLELDAQQVEAAFQFFTFHFWNSAQKEIKDQRAEAESCEKAPFGILEPDNILDQIEQRLKQGGVKSAAFAAGSWDFSHASDAVLLTNIGLENPTEMGAKNTLHANDQALPLQAICFRETGYLIPTNELSANALCHCLTLNAKQKDEVEKLIKRLTSQAPYQFHHQVLRGQLKGREVRRLQSTTPVLIKASTTKQETMRPPEFLSRNELESLRPDFKDDRCSCSVTYRWTIEQYQLPEGSKPDSLYSKWEERQKLLDQRIATLRQHIAKLEADSQSIAEGLKKFIGRFITGKKQKWSETATELTDLAAKKIQNCTRTERLKIVERLNQLQRELADSVAELEQKKSEAQQEQQWEEKRDQLKSEYQSLNNDLQKAESELEAKESEFAKELTKREAEFEAFLQKEGIRKESLAKYRSELEEKAGKKNKDKNPEEAETARQKLDALKQIDPESLKMKINADLKLLKKTTEFLDIKVKQKEKELSNHGEKFVPKKNTSTGSHIDTLKKEPTKSTSSLTPLPTDFPEDLPKVGTLFAHQNQRYLGIRDWMDEEAGRTEAQRLNAKLCFNPNP